MTGSKTGRLLQAAGQQHVPSVGVCVPYNHPAAALQPPVRHTVVLHRLLPCRPRPGAQQAQRLTLDHDSPSTRPTLPLMVRGCGPLTDGLMLKAMCLLQYE